MAVQCLDNHGDGDPDDCEGASAQCTGHVEQSDWWELHSLRTRPLRQCPNTREMSRSSVNIVEIVQLHIVIFSIDKTHRKREMP